MGGCYNWTLEKLFKTSYIHEAVLIKYFLNLLTFQYKLEGESDVFFVYRYMGL